VGGGKNGGSGGRGLTRSRRNDLRGFQKPLLAREKVGKMDPSKEGGKEKREENSQERKEKVRRRRVSITSSSIRRKKRRERGAPP